MGWPVQIILPKERVQGINWRIWIFSFLAILSISLMAVIIIKFAVPVEGANYFKLFFLLFLVVIFIFFISLSVRVYYFGLCLSAFEAYEKESALTKKDWTEWASRELYVSAYKLFTPLDISQSKIASGQSVEVYSEQQLQLRGHSGEAYNEEQIIYELLASVRAKIMELAIICSFDVMFTYGSSNVSFSTFKECWVSIGLPERCLNNYSNLHGTIQQEFDRLTSTKNNLVTIILSANIEGVEGFFAESTEFASILLVTHQRELSGKKNNGVALRELVCGKALAKQELIHMMTYQPDVLETSKVFFSNMNVDEVLDISDLLRTSYLSMGILWEYKIQDMNLLLGRLGDKHFWLVFTLALYVAEKSGEAVLMISSVGNDYIFNVVKPFKIAGSNKLTTSAKWRVIGLVSCLIIFGVLTFLGCYYYGDSLEWISTKEKITLWFLCMLLFSVFLILMNFGVWSYQRGLRFQSSRSDKSGIPDMRKAKKNSTAKSPIKNYLKSRYNLFWRRKVRLLLITGDEAAIEKLVPGLQQQQWLEGNRTVLIYGGSLTAEHDKEKYTALRKLRRGRPLDGIVRVMPQSLNLTPQISDNDLRGLEKISELLRYSAPVWLWQLCDSTWSQAKRTEQAVGASFPLRAKEDDVIRQLELLLPALRAQGVSQVAENNGHDFLLRLGQHLKDGGIARWAQQLVPWLSASQQRVPLRGLMFSLPDNRPAAIAEGTVGAAPVDAEKYVPESQRHALTLPVTWQGIVDDCTCVRGRRVGMAWEQTLAWTLMAIIGVWGAGTLLSFALNYEQISSVAAKARNLVEHPAVSDNQLTAMYELRNAAGRLQHNVREGSPWYQRFGLDHNQQLLATVLPWYGVANNRLIRDPANAALIQKLSALAGSAPNSDQRAQLAKPGYDQLKAWLMMARPDKADGAYYAQTMKAVQPTRMGISTGLWQSLSPDLWAFYISELPKQPQWKITPDIQLVSQSRQVLLQQIGRRNAESTLYENMLKSVRRNFADVSLEDMTSGTDARRLFSTDELVPGMFTRQAWEGGIQQAIEKAANSRRDEIDWVLSDSRKAVSSDLSPEALKARLTQRYFTDFAGSWLSFLNSLQLNPANNIADVTDQLTLMSDVRQSPLIALMNTLAWQGQTGQQREGLSDSIIKSAKDLVGGKDKPAIDQFASGPQGPLDETFGPLLQLLGKNKGSNVMSADTSLSLQTYLTRITRVRLRLQQVASASDPQEMMQTLAQTVFQGKSVDLTDTQQYGSLISASLGEEWSGFGSTMFVQPLTQAWETVLQPSAASLNDKWSRSVVANWHTAFDGRFPFSVSKSDASLPMLAEFIRKDSGRIERFLTTELSGVLHKEGSQWVPDKVNSQGLTFNPAFLRAINQLSQLSDILFTDGSQGISFELQARPVPHVVETQLTIDGQKLHYFNQMADWQSFRWPGDTYKPGTMLTWTTVNAGARLFGDYSGSWGFIRWLDQGKRQQLDRSQWMMSFTAPDGRTLQWVLRSQLGKGPLALLALRGFTLPGQIFSVDSAAAAQALMTNTGNSDMDGVE